MASILLAGPIVRRVTENRICIWLATKQKLSLKLKILSDQRAEIGVSRLDEFFKCRVQLGENLFIYLLQAYPQSDKKFPHDNLLYYQLVEVSAKGEETELDLSKLTYKGAPYPGFYIPGKIKTILHGSCRKPHGGEPGQEDSLSYADDILADTLTDLDKRPGLLLLTGDQIYADDVPIGLLSMLRKQAGKLFPDGELLPVAFKKSTDKTVDPATIPLHSRKQLLKDGQSGFSSTESENHLFSFGEFAAMYLYVLGNADNWKPALKWEALEKECGENVEEAKKAFDEQLEALKQFQKTLPKVRRLLANIPTYMIFDDHDVTDDWNITSLWYDDVRKSALGQRIVSNALASYWAFQGWGNDPDNFDKELSRSIYKHLLNQKATGDMAERYDLHTWKHRGWGFSIPVDPPIIALDSRTQRDSLPDSYLPLLLDRYARDWLKVEWLKLKSSQFVSEQTCPVFISAVPVMGFSVVKKAQKLVLQLAGLIDRYKWIKVIENLLGESGFLTRKLIRSLDAEAWVSNQQGFLDFMICLSEQMHVKQCTFISGDTHYSFSALAKYTKTEFSLYCYQLTSSSFKNKPAEFQAIALKEASEFKAETSKFTGWLRRLIPWNIFKSWETRVHLLPDNEKTYVTAECNLGLIEFIDGRPVKHILQRQNDARIYTLPDIKYIDTLK